MLYGEQPGSITTEMAAAANSVAAYLSIAVGRLRAQEQTRSNEARLRSLVESTDVVIWEYDVQARRFLYVSPKAARYGYPIQQWLQPDFWERVLHPDDRDAALAECAVEHRLTCRIFGADGALYWIEDHVTAPERLANGRVLLRGAMVDVTAQKETALELAQARDQADAASRAKSEFLIPKATAASNGPKIALHGRILLAEDGPDNQRLIAFHLRKAAAEVVLADNGAIALQLIEEADTPFDLLLTDMQMPELDGYGLAHALRQRGSDIPIVALTAHAMAEDRERCLKAGCNDYATKPIDRSKLLATCAAWIRKHARLPLSSS